MGDEVDSNCDGAEACYADDDDDGYTDTTATVDSVDTDCADSGEGSSSDPDEDCDDADASITPDAEEILDDGIDQDCDGVDEETDKIGKDGCGCSSNPAPGRGAGMLIGLLALVGLRRRKPRAVDEGGDASVA